jgi:hypothetical protein
LAEQELDDLVDMDEEDKDNILSFIQARKDKLH